MRPFLLTLSLCALMLSGCGGPSHDKLNAGQSYVRLSAVSGNPSAAYFTVNGGPVADRLMSVTSPLVGRAEMHDMKSAGGMMMMTPLDDGLDVPAASEIAFAPGGRHVMLFDVSPKVAAGTRLPLVLRFASGATVDVEADVVAAGAEAPGHHHH